MGSHCGLEAAETSEEFAQVAVLERILSAVLMLRFIYQAAVPWNTTMDALDRVGLAALGWAALAVCRVIGAHTAGCKRCGLEDRRSQSYGDGSDNKRTHRRRVCQSDRPAHKP